MPVTVNLMVKLSSYLALSELNVTVFLSVKVEYQKVWYYIEVLPLLR